MHHNLRDCSPTVAHLGELILLFLCEPSDQPETVCTKNGNNNGIVRRVSEEDSYRQHVVDEDRAVKDQPQTDEIYVVQ